ncbi:MAG: hypothetical protein R3F20_06900 [Planctomycetota bacterium]
MRWLPLAPGGTSDHAALIAHGRRAETSSNQGFRFDLGEFPSEAVAIAGYDWKGSPLTELEIVTPDAAAPDVVLRGLVPPERDHVIVRAFAPDGHVLSKVGFETLVRWPGQHRASSVTALKAPDGAFWLRLGPDDADRIAGHERFIRVSSPRFGSLLLPAPPGTRQLRADFAEPASVTVELNGGSAALLELVKVGLRPIAALPSSAVEAERAGGSRWTAGRLQPGRVAVEVWTGSRRWETPLVTAQEVELVTGANVLTLTLPDLQDLDVEVRGAAPGTRVTLRGAALPRPRDVSLGADRRVSFVHLPRGRYAVDVASSDPSYDRTIIDIPGPRDLVIRPR